MQDTLNNMLHNTVEYRKGLPISHKPIWVDLLENDGITPLHRVFFFLMSTKTKYIVQFPIILDMFGVLLCSDK